ncbi:MAG TPA: DinB family protein [Methylomirabilota bacterium]|nr:DinB family protein [Methylomirabilota bacterium]
MPADRSHEAHNNAERARLEAFVARLSDADLQRPAPGDWTVAGVLAHLAFWDQRAFLLLDQWEKTGKAPADEPPGIVDWVNDAAKPMFLAMPPRRAAELALSIARATDAKVAGLRDDIIEKNKAAGTPVSLLRAAHRKEHLDELEHALKTP